MKYCQNRSYRDCTYIEVDDKDSKGIESELSIRNISFFKRIFYFIKKYLRFNS